MKNMKNIIILLVSILLTGGILLVADQGLRPLIDAAGSGAYEETLTGFFEGAEEFIKVDLTDESGPIKEIYEVPNMGYAYILESKGFGPEPILYAMGIQNDGTISGYEVLASTETMGYGDRIEQEEFTSTVIGKASTTSFDVLAGATVSSSAVVEGLSAATAHFNEVMGVEPGEAVEEEKAPAPISFGAKLPLFREVSEKNQGVILSQEEDGDVIRYTVEVNGYAVGEYGADGVPNTMVVTVNPTEKIIVSVTEVVSHDTKNLGDKIENEEFLKQFENLSYADESVEVDAISAATISSESIFNGILKAIKETN